MGQDFSEVKDPRNPTRLVRELCSLMFRVTFDMNAGNVPTLLADKLEGSQPQSIDFRNYHNHAPTFESDFGQAGWADFGFAKVCDVTSGFNHIRSAATHIEGNIVRPRLPF